MAEKRQYEGGEGTPHAKRGGGAGPIAFKLLIDNQEAGYVIGTKGATIDSIQASSGASIRISHSSDFFPSTVKRTCMIQGNISVVQNALNQIFEKVLEERNRGGRVPPSEQLFMEIVVPNSAAGMIIGHGGETVQKIQNECNCKVTVSKARNEEYNQERRICITANNTADDVRSCLHTILDWVQRDGSSGNFAYVSYSHIFEESNDYQRGGGGYGRDGGGRGGGGRGRGGDYGREGGYDGYYGPGDAPPRDRRYSGPPPPEERHYPSTAPPPLPSRPQTNSSSGRVQVKATLEAPIPDALCWSLLRDGGRGIASLQHRSGATVTVTHTGECYDDGTLQRQSLATIKGTLPASQSALLLLEEMILRQGEQ